MCYLEAALVIARSWDTVDSTKQKPSSHVSTCVHPHAQGQQSTRGQSESTSTVVLLNLSGTTYIAKSPMFPGTPRSPERQKPWFHLVLL